MLTALPSSAIWGATVLIAFNPLAVWGATVLTALRALAIWGATVLIALGHFRAVWAATGLTVCLQELLAAVWGATALTAIIPLLQNRFFLQPLTPLIMQPLTHHDLFLVTTRSVKP